MRFKFIVAIIVLIFQNIGNAAAVDPFIYTSDKPNQMMVLNHGVHSLQKRLDLINKAKKSINVEYFIFTRHKSARLLIQALAKKAREGIKVKMLMDFFLIQKKVDRFVIHELKKSGVEVKYYNTTPLISVVEYQYRNHRKSLIIDESEAIVGGRNISDEYFDLSESYNFVDRDVWVSGEVAKAINHTFNIIWNDKESKYKKRPIMPNSFNRKRRSSEFQFESRLRRWHKKVKSAVNYITENPADHRLKEAVAKLAHNLELNSKVHTCNKTSFYSDSPNSKTGGRMNHNLKRYIFKRIEAAKNTIYIESPYFIVNSETRRSLNVALDNGVKIHTITNGLYSTDAIYVNTIFTKEIGKWLDKGLIAYLFKGESMDNYPTLSPKFTNARWGTHAKSIVFDDDSVMIGSYNFDPRSNNLNSEMAIFCDGNKDLVEEVKLNMLERLESSHKVESREDLKKVKFKNVKNSKIWAFYIQMLPSIILRPVL